MYRSKVRLFPQETSEMTRKLFLDKEGRVIKSIGQLEDFIPEPLLSSKDESLDLASKSLKDESIFDILERYPHVQEMVRNGLEGGAEGVFSVEAIDGNKTFYEFELAVNEAKEDVQDMCDDTREEIAAVSTVKEASEDVQDICGETREEIAATLTVRDITGLKKIIKELMEDAETPGLNVELVCHVDKVTEGPNKENINIVPKNRYSLDALTALGQDDRGFWDDFRKCVNKALDEKLGRRVPKKGEFITMEIEYMRRIYKLTFRTTKPEIEVAEDQEIEVAEDQEIEVAADKNIKIKGVVEDATKKIEIEGKETPDSDKTERVYLFGKDITLEKLSEAPNINPNQLVIAITLDGKVVYENPKAKGFSNDVLSDLEKRSDWMKCVKTLLETYEPSEEPEKLTERWKGSTYEFSFKLTQNPYLEQEGQAHFSRIAFIFGTDITEVEEQKRLNEILNAKQERLEAANEETRVAVLERDALVEMRHEARLGINGIMEHVASLSDTDLSDDQRGILEGLDESCRVALEKVNIKKSEADKAEAV